MATQEGAEVAVLEVLHPVAQVAAKTVHPAPRLRDLSGCKIGLYSNTKPGAGVALQEIARLLESKFKGLKFESFAHTYPHGMDLIENIAKTGCHAMISATAD